MADHIYTIGYSNRTQKSLLEALRTYKIDALCDVRSTPYSAKYPEFNREELRIFLKANNIHYLFLGKELGARPEDQSCYINHTADYDLIARSINFKKGLKRIREGIQKGFNISLMCLEADPITCHRTILVAKHLRSNNLVINHILPNNKLELHSDLEKRLMASFNIQSDFINGTDTHSALEEAYTKQGKRIAYVETDIYKENDEQIEGQSGKYG